jgi:hypothetical protein
MGKFDIHEKDLNFFPLCVEVEGEGKVIFTYL